MPDQWTGFFPAQCECGHIFLEKYRWKEPQNGNIGFCWCGFCRTRVNVKALEVKENNDE